MSLTEYRRKRDFHSTREPRARGSRRGRIFVVQLHHASHRHFDFRLELDGVLKSWAVPKGPSFDPAVKRLAVEVEDHPAAYADFSGEIPQGNYGAGHVDIFDRGTWEAIGDARAGLAAGNLKFILHGDVLRGAWALVRTGKPAPKPQWLLIKHRDEFAGKREADDFVDPASDRPLSAARRRMPSKKTASKSVVLSPEAPRDGVPKLKRNGPAGRSSIENAPFAPELCKSATTPPDGSQWLHEVKWDGYRMLATISRGKVRLWSRNGLDWTNRIPAIAKAVAALKLREAQLDGEVLVLKNGRADFNALQAALSAHADEKLVYMLFDLVQVNGESLRDAPLTERKARLAALLAKGTHARLRYSQHQIGNGPQVFAQAVAAGLEGIVSKRVDSSYLGTRSGDWVKMKARPSDEFVVVGYTEPKGSRSGIGALLLARYDAGKLHYAGRVGTGLNHVELARVRKELETDAVAEPTAADELMEKKDRRFAIWVRPRLVVEVFYQSIGKNGLLRHVAFKAFRPDKDASDLDDARPKAHRAKQPIARRYAQEKKPMTKLPRKPAAAAGVEITHPGRKVFTQLDVSKGDVADYYRAVAPWLLKEIGERPLSILRCPEGADKACFFQKHLTPGLGAHVHGVDIKEKNKREKYIFIDDETGLLELVQMNVLEFHPWGARIDDVDNADRIVFDLDPHAGVAWSRIANAARSLRARLESVGLESFLRTSGGKGLHVVVPLDPPAPWAAAKQFAEAVADAMATMQPGEFVAVAGESKRRNRIFIDWLRNARGATSVASYSLRARTRGGVAMPLEWSELARIKSADAFTVLNAVAKIRRRKNDPWQALYRARQRLPDLR